MKRSKAMSLLEMVIVVVIVGILISIAVPSYQRAILQARVEEAKVNLRAIYAGQEMYKTKNGSYFAGLTENDINNALHLNLERNYWAYIASQGGIVGVGQADYQDAPPDLGFRIDESGAIDCYTGCPY